MADTSRFPEGVLLQSSTSVARPVGTLVLASDGILYRSTNATVATYVPVGALTPGLGSRVLNVQAASSAALNAGTGAGAQNFSDTYTVPAGVPGIGDVLRVTTAGTFTRAAAFDLSIGVVIQAVNRGAFTRAAIGAASTWKCVTTVEFISATAARFISTVSIGDAAAAAEIGDLYDDQGYVLANAGAIQMQATMSGGNAGNTIIQTLRTVELIKASA